MQIILSSESISDLKEIQIYIFKDNPKTADKITKIILDKIGLLEIFPKLGSLIHGCENTHRLIVANLPYLIFYEIDNSIIKILRIYHTSRQWPKQFE